MQIVLEKSLLVDCLLKALSYFRELYEHSSFPIACGLQTRKDSLEIALGSRPSRQRGAVLFRSETPAGRLTGSGVFATFSALLLYNKVYI